MSVRLSDEWGHGLLFCLLGGQWRQKCVAHLLPQVPYRSSRRCARWSGFKKVRYQVFWRNITVICKGTHHQHCLVSSTHPPLEILRYWSPVLSSVSFENTKSCPNTELELRGIHCSDFHNGEMSPERLVVASGSQAELELGPSLPTPSLLGTVSHQ